jgi:hypothetical protein
MATAFDRPIPGQSLTGEPRNFPWEQPAEMSSIEEVTKFYIGRLANQDVIDDFGALCQAGVSLAPIVESVYLVGVMRGIHSLDTGMLAAPTIHTFLKQAIESMGISVKDTSDDPQKRAEAAEMERFRLVANKYLLTEDDDDMSDPGKEMLSEMLEEEGEAEQPAKDVMPEETMNEEPTGLMARG